MISSTQHSQQAAGVRTLFHKKLSTSKIPVKPYFVNDAASLILCDLHIISHRGGDKFVVILEKRGVGNFGLEWYLAANGWSYLKFEICPTFITYQTSRADHDAVEKVTAEKLKGKLISHQGEVQFFLMEGGEMIFFFF